MKKNIKNYLVVKHIDLVEARYKLTLQEQKLVLNVAVMIKPDDVDFHDYHISIKEFLSLMEVEGHNHEQIKTCADSLLKKPLTIRQADGWLKCNWFSSVKCIDSAGLIQIHFDPALKPYLLQLKNRYTAYKLENIMTMTSTYAIRLYELLKQYFSIGHRRFELDDLKLKLGVEDRYQKYDHFNQKVLIIAEREINDKSDILIAYESIKTGRKVTAIEFTMEANPKKKPPAWLSAPESQPVSSETVPPDNDIIASVPPPQQKIDQTLIESLTFPGTAPELVRQTIAEIGVEAVTEIHADFLKQLKRSQAGKGKKIDAPDKYYANHLRKRIGVKTPKQRQDEKDRQTLIEKRRQEKAQKENQAVLESQQTRNEAERLEKLVAALSESDREGLRALAIQKMPQSMIKIKASVKNRMESLVEEFMAGKLK